MRLRQLRHAKGWRQTDLAQKARVTQALISQLETGKKTRPSVVPLLRIANALGVSVDELVTEPDTARPSHDRPFL
ncbi:MAG: helix-turn-helix transcriptional regulator [Nitrospira sp.]|nr:helix-turn-helix transcriptional regulator [Nitrospira sp.]